MIELLLKTLLDCELKKYDTVQSSYSFEGHNQDLLLLYEMAIFETPFKEHKPSPEFAKITDTNSFQLISLVSSRRYYYYRADLTNEEFFKHAAIVDSYMENVVKYLEVHHTATARE
jgi:hypothetical protein